MKPYWGHLGAILGPCGLPGIHFWASPSNVFIEQKTHAVSKCKNRSRSAPVQRKRLSNVYLGAILGPSWGHLGAISGHLGSILGTSWVYLKAILEHCEHLGVLVRLSRWGKHIGAHFFVSFWARSRGARWHFCVSKGGGSHRYLRNTCGMRVAPLISTSSYFPSFLLPAFNLLSPTRPRPPC